MTTRDNLDLLNSLHKSFASGSVKEPAILTECGYSPTGTSFETTPLKYDDARGVKNAKFDFRPAAIILVRSKEQVQQVVKFVNENNSRGNAERLELRVRSSGHDHEGECSGTDTWVIDFRKMNDVTPRNVNGDWRVGIQPGANFTQIGSKLARHNIAIPHGTCETVAVAGYTLGGGWGPWTRRYGMACERLIEAEVVLGDGTSVRVHRGQTRHTKEGALMWALCGGGGFSYGIVTDFVFQAFEVPTQRCSAKVTFNSRVGGEIAREVIPRSAREILEQWVSFVRDASEGSLLGTNLAMIAENQCTDPYAPLECTFRGYFDGAPQTVETLVRKRFRLGDSRHIETIRVESGNESKPFDGWEFPDGINLESAADQPHKITSRLATREWNDASCQALISALQSRSLVAPRSSDVRQYVTLGAITGPFYSKYLSGEQRDEIAFPYRDRLFTVQFQAWWDHEHKNRRYANLAEDWIDECRHALIPGTHGSFISFKDSAVPTGEYFCQHYDALKEVKRRHSEDHDLLFRTRKTIV